MKNKKLLTLIISIAIGVIIISLVIFFMNNSKEDNIGNETNSENLQENMEIETIVDENEFINSYLFKIYMGTDSYIPTFTDINSADEQWIWECAYRNLINFENLKPATTVKKEEIEKSAKQLFGDNFNKEFPKEGLEFWLEPQGNEYFYATASTEKDFYNDYVILSTESKNNLITATIVEYKYNEIFIGEPTKLDLYKVGTDEIVKSYDLEDSNSSNYSIEIEKLDEAILYVEEHPEQFSTAKVTFEHNKETDELYVVSVER